MRVGAFQQNFDARMTEFRLNFQRGDSGPL